MRQDNQRGTDTATRCCGWEFSTIRSLRQRYRIRREWCEGTVLFVSALAVAVTIAMMRGRASVKAVVTGRYEQAASEPRGHEGRGYEGHGVMEE